MRLDKFLKISRIIKRRSIANEAATGGRIEVNGQVAKPAKQLKEGDIVSVQFGNKKLVFKVLSMPEYVKKEDVESMYEVLNED